MLHPRSLQLFCQDYFRSRVALKAEQSHLLGLYTCKMFSERNGANFFPFFFFFSSPFCFQLELIDP